MEIIPAIDLRKGQVVRLNQGNFNRQTTFSDDPLKVAQGFVDAGAIRIHVVDLDGALEGGPQQSNLYASLARDVSVPLEVGGGFRSMKHVDSAFAAGVGRIVLGTAAIADPGMVDQAIQKYGAERIVVGLDANNGKVAVSGWTKTTRIDAIDLMGQMFAVGIRRFVFTDIARDGTLTEPNFESVAVMIQHGLALGAAHVIASGGIGELDHLRRLAKLGADGAIVGTAIYRGTINLAEAITELGAY
jgi:phosphoribosylformimino-5-aminoimidazole carboxamide ribotide isomerase